MQRRLIGVLLGVCAAIFAACGTEIPQITPTVAPSRTPTETPATVVMTPSSTPTVFSSPTFTPSATWTPSPTFTLPPTLTETITPSPSFTPTETLPPTETFTPVPTDTPTPSDTPPPSPTPIFTSTPTETPTDTPTRTSTNTATRTNTPTSTPTNTATTTPLPTETPTQTPRPTNTPTRTPSNTATSRPTNTATQTPRPTSTPTRTPSNTATSTLRPTNTATQTPSNTARPTNTPTRTPSNTATARPTSTPIPPTATRTPTNTPRSTNTATSTPRPTSTPTRTPSNTATARPTSTPIPPTATPQPTDTPRPTNTATARPTSTPIPPTATPQPTDTPRPTNTATSTARPTSTPIPPTATPQPTDTPRPPTATRTLAPTLAPQVVDTPTLIPPSDTPTLVEPTLEPPVPTDTAVDTLPPPTIDALPTFATLAPSETIPPITAPPIVTPIVVTLTPSPAPVTPTPLPPPPTPEPTFTPFVPDVPPTLLPGFDQITTRSFALSITGGEFTAGDISLIAGARRFARYPLDANRYAVVDPRGMLYFINDLTGSPIFATFKPFDGPPPTQLEDNNAVVAQVAWSPDGQYIAFLVDTENDGSTNNDSSNDGVWFADAPGGTVTGPAYQLLRDCPPQLGCLLVDRGGGPFEYRSQSFEWNYSSTAILIQVRILDWDRNGFVIVTRTPDPNYANVRQPVYRYDYAAWTPNETQIVVSGRNPADRTILGYLNPFTGQEIVVLDATGVLHLQNGIQYQGRIYALGAPAGDPNAPLRIVSQEGAFLTEPIGIGRPERVEWSPDRSAVLVVVPETTPTGIARRYYVARIDNATPQEITAEVANALAVEWVLGTPSLTTPLPPTPTVPPVAAAFAPGETVRVVTSELNVRAGPSLNFGTIYTLGFNDVVTITGAPVEADGYPWYPVRTSIGIDGWVAGRINEQDVLAR